MNNKSILISTIVAVLLIAGALYFAVSGSSLQNPEVATTQNIENADTNSQDSGAIVENLSAQDFQDKMKNAQKAGQNFVLLDIRTKEEFDAGHLKGAKNIDYYQTQNFVNELSKMDKNLPYYIYCRSGHRSGETVKIMRNLGFKKIYNLAFGINSWISSGLPVEK